MKLYFGKDSVKPIGCFFDKKNDANFFMWVAYQVGYSKDEVMSNASEIRITSVSDYLTGAHSIKNVVGTFREVPFDVFVGDSRITIIRDYNEPEDSESDDSNNGENEMATEDKGRDESHYKEAAVDPLLLMKKTYPLVAQYWVLKFQVDKYFYRQGRKEGTDDGFKCERYLELLNEVQEELRNAGLNPYSFVGF